MGVENVPKEMIHQCTHDQSFSQRRQAIIANIGQLRGEIEAAESESEKRIFESSMRCEIAALTRLNKEQEDIHGSLPKDPDQTDEESMEQTEGNEPPAQMLAASHDDDDDVEPLDNLEPVVLDHEQV